MITNLHHVDIIIPKGSESKARQFYCEILGLREIQKPDEFKPNGGLWLELESSQIHLSTEKFEGVDPRKTKAHVAYEVDSLQETVERLETFNIDIKDSIQISGHSRVNTHDPFGNRVELIQNTEVDISHFDKRGLFLCIDGPARTDEKEYSQMKLCFTSVNKAQLMKLLLQFSKEEDCYFVKLSDSPKNGMYLGRCFFTNQDKVGKIWAKYKNNPYFMVNVQNDNFTKDFRGKIK